MRQNKKGLSTIVVTLIIILLSLVAVGIVWLVVNTFIKGGSQGVDINAKCLSVDVEATRVVCSNVTATLICDVTFTRTGTLQDALGGVKLLFKNKTSEITSELITVSGNIQALVDKKEAGIDTGVAIADGLDQIQVTPFFVDSSGNEQLCSQTDTFNF
jgi:hypothetical protein